LPRCGNLDFGVKIFDAIRKKGIRTCVAIVFDRYVPAWLLRIRRFNVYEMDPTSVQPSRSESVVVQWSESEGETREVENFLGPQRSVVSVGADDMRVCYARVDGEMAGALWVAKNVFMESGLCIRYGLGAGEAWIFGAYVANPFRRHGVYSRILSLVLPSLKSKGTRRIMLAVNPDNLASRKVHERYAKRKLGTAIAVRFLNFAFCAAGDGLQTNRSFTWNHKKRPIVIRFPNETSC